MSIGPVQSFGLLTDPKAEDATPGARQGQPKAAHSPEEKAAHTQAAEPKPEKVKPVKAANTVAEPQYEVKVLRDSQVQDQIVIKYTDTKTGNVVLQVPSTQVLGVARGIYEELQEQAKNLAEAQNAAEEPHGH